MRDEPGDKFIVEAENYKWMVAITANGEIVVRIQRPNGTGRPLYEEMRLSSDEAIAIAQLLIQTRERMSRGVEGTHKI